MARGAQGAPAAPVPSPRAPGAGRRASPPQLAGSPCGPPGAGRRRVGRRFWRSSRAPLAGTRPTRPDSRHPPPGRLGAAAMGNLRPYDRAHGGRGGSAAAGTRPAQGPKRNNVPALGGGLIAQPALGSRCPRGSPIAAPEAAWAPPRYGARRSRTPARPGAVPPAPSLPGWPDAHPPSRAALATRAGA